MPKNWTAAQNTAIKTRDKTLLVSAAAGSGKTATLTERIIRSVTDPQNPADISDMLIVTFTRAAASELRQRIFGAVSDALTLNPSDRHLSEQLIKLGSAKICTIDSFCLDVIRSNFAVLGLPPSFRIADQAEVEILEKNIMNDVIDSFYNSGEAGFPLFAECFTGIRNQARLTDIFLNLYTHVSSYPEGTGFLKSSAEKTAIEADRDFFSTSYGKVLCSQSVDEIRHFADFFAVACDYISSDDAISRCYLGAFRHDHEFCLEFLDRAQNGGYAAARELICGYSPVKLSALKAEFRTDKSEMYKAMRTNAVDKIRKLAKKSFGLSPESISESMRRTAEYTHILYDVLDEFEKRLDSEKKARAFCDFSDLRRYAFRLLVDENGEPTETARGYAARFTDIYIDEYQDVDRVQDMIFKAISTPTNRFMVGDIKQSIYSFRGAEPQVFAAYKNSFPPVSDSAKSNDCASVFMSENFRCDKNIIDFTNAVCSCLFSACAGSIGYTHADDLVFSKAPPAENHDYLSPKVTVAVITPSEKDEESSLSESPDDSQETEDGAACEAEYIASEISRLLAEGRKADGTRIRPDDIAVLFRSKSRGEYVRRALDKAGIPTAQTDAVKYFESPDVLLALCLLNAIDNPQRDIYLAGLLRSPLFGFTLDDLVNIRTAAELSYSLFDALDEYAARNDDLLARKCRDFEEYLSEMRDKSASLPADKLLRDIFSSDLFAASGLFNSDESSDLLRLYDYARRFEAGAFHGLYNFIGYINRMIEEDKTISAGAQGSAEGCVSLMTIHHSKGLEFPVCFICGAGGRFNREDQRESLLYEPSVGVAMKIADESGFARINTPMREAILSVFSRNQTEEEMRVLYVALTRARERLYITSYAKNPDRLMSAAALRAEFPDRYTLLGCSSYLDWILTALQISDCDEFCTLRFIPSDTVSQRDAAAEPDEKISAGEVNSDAAGADTANVKSTANTDDTARNEAAFKRLSEVFSYVYPYSAVSGLPAKISVSEISASEPQETENDAVSLFSPEKEYEIPAVFRGIREHKPTPAERGTATHLFLQFCDFESAETNGPDFEISRLIENKFIPADSAEKIYRKELVQFFAGDFYALLRSARRIIREQRFNILLPSSCLYSDKEIPAAAAGEMLAVQGVIDIIFEDGNGNIFIADYKTDRLSQTERTDTDILRALMQKRHGRQLSCYAVAIERMFGKKCSGIYVYSTCAGKAVLIDAENTDI